MQGDGDGDRGSAEATGGEGAGGGGAREGKDAQKVYRTAPIENQLQYLLYL